MNSHPATVLSKKKQCRYGLLLLILIAKLCHAEMQGDSDIDGGESNRIDVVLLEMFTADLSAERVWYYFMSENMNQWVRPFMTIAGESGKVGEIFTPFRERDDIVYPFVTYEIIKVDPFKHLVSKMWHHKSKSIKVVGGYGILNLEEKNGKTKVIFNQITFASQEAIEKIIKSVADNPSSPYYKEVVQLLSKKGSGESYLLIREKYLNNLFVKLKKIISQESN